ncbi:MAG: DUF1499 domain-containing protein [Nitrospirae bacterium]|nr:MAG: DUF1499 domain-containing protein [Nitrospirota bacterium]
MNALPPCPSSPNCVSSLSADPAQFIQPLIYSGTLLEAKARLISVLQSMPQIRIVVDCERYLHAECRSRLFSFVDDLEFLIEETKGIIHVRSASRIGYWDFGANRKRVEAIRSRFQALSSE